MGSSSASADWSLGAFSDTTGHPSCVTFFEQRLVFAATLKQSTNNIIFLSLVIMKTWMKTEVVL